MNFILFFDQFEELFTYPRALVEEFSEQLSQLLYSTVPSNFRKRIDHMDEENELPDALHQWLYEKPEVKVVFSVRADRLSQLNALTDRHPTILQNCYELDALNRQQAEHAIVCPAKADIEDGFESPPFHFSADAIQKIIASIANPQDGKIETATLQIICRYVEEELVKGKGGTQISGDLLGDIADIFKQYYEGILSRLTAEGRTKAQYLIEDELIEEGRRNTLTATYIKSKFGLDERLLQHLEQSSLLRKERDAAGRILYEISHDTLVSAINKVAEGRRRIEEVERNKKLEKQIQEERRRVEELMRARNQAVQRLRLARVMVFIAILMMGVAAFYLVRANENEKVAKEQERIAQANARMAKEQEQIALSNAKKAEEQKDMVNKAYLELKKEKDMKRVNELIDAGQQLRGIRNDFRACDLYKDAVTILSNYPEEELLKNELTNKILSVCGR